MNEGSAVLIVPNTKDGLSALKYLASELVKHDIYVKLVTKQEFDKHINLLKGDSNARSNNH
jgi:hypothetical protein